MILVLVHLVIFIFKVSPIQFNLLIQFSPRRHVTTGQVEKFFRKGKTELAINTEAALIGVLTPMLARDVKRLATGKVPAFKTLIRALKSQDWRLSDAASYICSLNTSEDETQGIFDALLGMEWSSGSSGVCICAGFRYFRQVRFKKKIFS